MTENERIEYLDIAKGVGILLVIIGHVELVAAPVRQYIASFHMPLFFLISGMLLWYKKEEQKEMESFVRKKGKSIMLPYVIFSMAYLFIECARMAVKGSTGWGAIFRQLYQTFCLQGISVLWFLPALFLGEVCFVWIRQNSNHLQTAFCLPALLMTTYFINVDVQAFMTTHADSLLLALAYDLASMLLRNMFCVALVGIGYYCGMFLLQFSLHTAVEAGLGAAALIVTGFLTKLNGGVDLRGMILGNLALYLLCSVLGTLGVIFLCRTLESLPLRPIQKAGKYFGKNSMLIMVTHLDFRILYISIEIAGLIRVLTDNNIVICLLIIALVCGAEVLLIEFVNRILPRFLKTIRKSS